MGKSVTFAEWLEAADQFTVDEQESFIDILRRRIMDYRRHEISQFVADARNEFRKGEAEVKTPDDIMEEILS